MTINRFGEYIFTNWILANKNFFRLNWGYLSKLLLAGISPSNLDKPRVLGSNCGSPSQGSTIIVTFSLVERWRWGKSGASSPYLISLRSRQKTLDKVDSIFPAGIRQRRQTSLLR